MTDTATATVETLTAEVRTLVVGSRQVTMSVYSQLDFVEPDEIEAWGRVRPRDGLAGWIYLVGRRIQGGDLVRSGAPASEQAIGNSLNWHRPRDMNAKLTLLPKAPNTARNALRPCSWITRRASSPRAPTRRQRFARKRP
jgi:hypothetical protein